MYEWADWIRELKEQNVPFVLVTLAETVGSAPQIQGAKALVTKDGLRYGTVGGGRLEAKAIAHAFSLLEQESGQICDFARWNLIKDVGMTCGGVVSLLFEVFRAPRWKIVIFGAGHVSQSLIPLLCGLDCHVTCVDDRPEWLERLPERPNLRKILSDDAKSLVRDLPSDGFYVLVTQGHKTDLPILHELLLFGTAPYVGVIGSRSKAAILRRDLLEAGVRDELVRKFHCPIGLPIGNSTPAEISISITAQLLEKRGELRPELSGARRSVLQKSTQ